MMEPTVFWCFNFRRQLSSVAGKSYRAAECQELKKPLTLVTRTNEQLEDYEVTWLLFCSNGNTNVRLSNPVIFLHIQYLYLFLLWYVPTYTVLLLNPNMSSLVCSFYGLIFQIRIKNRACGLNWATYLTTLGEYQVKVEPPFIPGKHNVYTNFRDVRFIVITRFCAIFNVIKKCVQKMPLAKSKYQSQVIFA